MHDGHYLRIARLIERYYKMLAAKENARHIKGGGIIRGVQEDPTTPGGTPASQAPTTAPDQTQGQEQEALGSKSTPEDP